MNLPEVVLVFLTVTTDMSTIINETLHAWKTKLSKIRIHELFSSKVKSNLGCKFALEIRSFTYTKYW